uniref:Uncharacterized protein n=1 Tax=Anguilla anguilla TaxID=7936 RepID=A0A0E9TE11_ANGAN
MQITGVLRVRVLTSSMSSPLGVIKWGVV